MPQPSAHLLSNHYKATRSEYYRLLSQASQSGNIVPFLHYAAQGFVDGLRDQLRLIREVQHDLAWRDYVHEFFKDKRPSESTVRKRLLVLALSRENRPVPRSKLPTLSTEVALAYANKTGKALSRDTNYLIKHGLIRRKSGGFLSWKKLMLAFRPRQRKRAQPHQPKQA